ncbi:MAG: dihydroneopterin aldolase [Bacteroidota bacterium]|nr:dihydroneopterin aldolase [Bacteroidota bacterium]MDP4229834.1 dihydroneopterin aldolase [Bacteroidota bacterium]MDP4236185.1 dihydroneopterin aldolase [Bacteroidota bacterium]
MFIRLNGISLFAHHGAYEQEIKNGNNFEIDLEVEVPDTLGSETDELHDALDYTKLFQSVLHVSESRRYNLLEAFVSDICTYILSSFPDVGSIGVKVRKLDPPMSGRVKSVEVELRKKREHA